MHEIAIKYAVMINYEGVLKFKYIHDVRHKSHLISKDYYIPDAMK